MSDQVALEAISRMNMREVLMSPYNNSFTADLIQLARANPEDENKKAESRRNDMCQTYGFQTPRQDKPFAFAAGLAFIPVSGTLINRFGQCWGYVTGYNFIRSQLNAALADDEVVGIVLDLNSHGGEAAGCFELADDIFKARDLKPILGVIDSNCYSACYAIGSACTRLVAIPSGGAGSVGVITMHVDASKMYKEWGLEFTLIYSGSHKADRNQFEALPKSVREDMQRGVDKTREKFASVVARNRSITIEAVLDTEAGIYRADEAVNLGLIDAVSTPSEAVSAFFNELNGLDTQGDEDMSTTAPATNAAQQQQQPAPQAGDVAAASAQARTDERARMSSIMNSEAAKGRSKMASHLAFNTSMSADDAIALLNVAALEDQPAPAAQQQPAAAAAEQQQQQQPAPAAQQPAAPAAANNLFQQAMDTTPNPNIPASASAAPGGDDNGENHVAAILGAQNAACGTGYKVQ